MKVLQFIGRKNSGKTTLVVELVEALTALGLHIGSIKHSCHVHDLDRPGSDSDRHRSAGSSPAIVVAKDRMAVHLPFREGEDLEERFAALFEECDLVLVEGNPGLPGVKVEVWRAEVGGEPLANEITGVIAVVSDDEPAVPVPIWRRGDREVLVLKVLQLTGLDDSWRLQGHQAFARTEEEGALNGP